MSKGSARFSRITAGAPRRTAFCPDGDQERPAGAEAPSRQGPQAPDGLVRRKRRSGRSSVEPVDGAGRAGPAIPGRAHIRQRRDFQTVYDTGRKLHGRFMTIFVAREAGHRLAARHRGHPETRGRRRAEPGQAARPGTVPTAPSPTPASTSSSCRARALFDAPFGSLEAEYVAHSGRLPSVRTVARSADVSPSAWLWRVPAQLQGAAVAAVHRRLPVSSVVFGLHGRSDPRARRRARRLAGPRRGWPVPPVRRSSGFDPVPRPPETDQFSWNTARSSRRLPVVPGALRLPALFVPPPKSPPPASRRLRRASRLRPPRSAAVGDRAWPGAGGASSAAAPRPRPAARPLSATPPSARSSSRRSRCSAVFTNRGGVLDELDAEEVPRRDGQARRSRSGSAAAPVSRARSRCASAMPRVTALAEHGALPASSARGPRRRDARHRRR